MLVVVSDGNKHNQTKKCNYSQLLASRLKICIKTYDQMTRYIAFANQLSRYAPLQLWQSIMRGEAEAKILTQRCW
jgi:hypothetical protein